MGKICWINGQPYSVGLPTGGESRDDHDNQWDEMIYFLRKDCDNIFRLGTVSSWCQNKSAKYASHRAVRGYYSVRNWNSFNTAYSCSSIGFRPVLTPLNTDTLKPDSTLLGDIPNGQKIALVSLYVDGKPVDLSGENGPSYKKGEKVILGDRDKDKNNWLYVIKYKDLLWADRNILINISWDELKEQGFAD